VVRAVKKPVHISHKLKPMEKLSMYSDESQYIEWSSAFVK